VIISVGIIVMKSKKLQKATFAAGCFWGIEETFRTTKGVVVTTVGYVGGTMENPTYEDVCSSKTGHAEAVQVTFDPSVVSYEELVAIFWKIHDPTTKNRQGLDIGPQYRSVIFYHNEEQRNVAEKSKKLTQRFLDKKHKIFKRKIVTEIVPARKFFKAEEYHQKYLMKRGENVC